MISILNRWRQFGRRYFWPHLLLGMVAAGVGLPGTQGMLTDKIASSLNSHMLPHLNTLALWQENSRRAGLTIDYWHQYAIRTVIRHLSFSLTSVDKLQTEADTLPLLVTLNALLTREARPTTIRPDTSSVSPVCTPHQVASWLAAVLGIRAGPAFSA